MIATGIDFVRAAAAVRRHLDQRHRFAHTLRVARMSAHLARLHGLDVNAARTAGLLHDLARLYSAERLVRDCEARGMAIDSFELDHPIVLHARLSAELAIEDFAVTEGPVLSAIRKHTVAAAVMSPLDTVVYLADALEPGRDYPERAAYAKLAERDLAAALRAVMESSISYLTARGEAVAPQTLAALHALTT